MLRTILLIMALTAANAHAQQGAMRDWLIEMEWQKKAQIRAANKAREWEIKLANHCYADGSLSYALVEDQLQVNTEISNQSCGASSGKYTIVVSTRNSTGKIKLADHKEEWSREDDSPVINTHYYDLKNDTTLESVYVTANGRNFCTCMN